MAEGAGLAEMMVMAVAGGGKHTTFALEASLSALAPTKLSRRLAGREKRDAGEKNDDERHSEQHNPFTAIATSSRVGRGFTNRTRRHDIMHWPSYPTRAR